jgi:hypothetical protein
MLCNAFIQTGGTLHACGVELQKQVPSIIGDNFRIVKFADFSVPHFFSALSKGCRFSQCVRCPRRFPTGERAYSSFRFRSDAGTV